MARLRMCCFLRMQTCDRIFVLRNSLTVFTTDCRPSSGVAIVECALQVGICKLGLYRSVFIDYTSKTPIHQYWTP
jgi:hypothetical protein